MVVTRIEGPRPPAPRDAAPAANGTPQRSAVEVKKREEEEGERAPKPEAAAPVVNQLFKPFSLSFRYVEELNRVVVKVIDPETGEPVREIPPESVIETLKILKEQLGKLVDEEA